MYRSLCWSNDRSITQSRLVLGVSTSPKIRRMGAKARATRMFQLMGRTMRRKQARVMDLGRIWKLLWEQCPTKTTIHDLWICLWVYSSISTKLHSSTFY